MGDFILLAFLLLMAMSLCIFSQLPSSSNMPRIIKGVTSCFIGWWRSYVSNRKRWDAILALAIARHPVDAYYWEYGIPT
jgi:hypothetical protein